MDMITKKESNFIKLVAMVAMLIDHIGVYLFPWEILRIIGRVSFPIFAYQIGVSYKMTSNRERYMKGLLIFGALSQIPHLLLREEFELNILFTLAFGVSLIWSLENGKPLFALPAIFLSFIVDYQIYGIAVIWAFYFIKDEVRQSAVFFVLTFFYSIYLGFPIQMFALLSLPIIFIRPFGIELPKNLFYIFYPAHLAVIYLIQMII